MRTLLSALFIGSLLAACTPAASDPASPLVSVRSDGGMCPDGGCASTLSIFEDGRCTRVSGKAEATEAAIDAGKIASLKQAIEDVDVEAVKSRPFTGTCPIAYDGMTLTYEFKKDGVTQTLNDCEYALDEPLFKMIAELSC